MPFPWNLWVMLMGGINMVGGLVFFNSLVGKLALAALGLAMMIMWAVYAKYGFVRLLGLGHLVAWPGLVWYGINLIQKGSSDQYFSYWLWGLVIVNSISLVIDLVDVIRYLMGTRQPL